MGKTRDLYKKIRDTKRVFHANMGPINTTSGSQKRAQATIRIGDVNYWTIKRNELGEMHHVTVTDVEAKGRVGVWIKGPLADSVVTNIRVPEGTKKYDVSVPVERVKFD